MNLSCHALIIILATDPLLKIKPIDEGFQFQSFRSPFLNYHKNILVHFRLIQKSFEMIENLPCHFSILLVGNQSLLIFLNALEKSDPMQFFKDISLQVEATFEF